MKFRTKLIPKNSNSGSYGFRILSFTRTSNLDLAEKLTKNRKFHYKTYRYHNSFHLKRILTEFYIDPIRKNTIPKGYEIGIRPLAGTDNVKFAKLHFDNKQPRNYRNQNPTVSKFFLPEF